MTYFVEGAGAAEPEPSPSASPRACPSIGILASSDDLHYVTYLMAHEATRTTATWKLYTARGAYSAVAHDVAVDEPVQSKTWTGFRSRALGFESPSEGPFLGFEMSARLWPADVVCETLKGYVSAADSPAVRRYATRLERTQAELEASPNTIALSPLHEAAFDCSDPFHDASVLKKVEADYPAAAARGLQSGTSVVKVELAPNGSLVKTSLYTSSGWPLLDQAALDAASLSTYRPERFACVDQGGAYLFVVEFRGVR